MLGTAGALISQNCVRARLQRPQVLRRRPAAAAARRHRRQRRRQQERTATRSSGTSIGNTERPGLGRYWSCRPEPDDRHALTESASTPASRSLSLPLTRGAADVHRPHRARDRRGRADLARRRHLRARAPGSATPSGRRPTVAPPTVVSTHRHDAPRCRRRASPCRTATGIAVLDGNTGRVALRFAVPAPPAGSVVYPLGAGFLVVEPDRQRGLPVMRRPARRRRGAGARRSTPAASDRRAAGRAAPGRRCCSCPATPAARRTSARSSTRSPRAGLLVHRHRPARPVRVARARPSRPTTRPTRWRRRSARWPPASAARCACSGTRSAAWWRARP